MSKKRRGSAAYVEETEFKSDPFKQREPFTGQVHLVARAMTFDAKGHGTVLESRTLCGEKVDVEEARWKRCILEWSHPSTCKFCLDVSKALPKAEDGECRPLPLPYQKEA